MSPARCGGTVRKDGPLLAPQAPGAGRLFSAAGDAATGLREVFTGLRPVATGLRLVTTGTVRRETAPARPAAPTGRRDKKKAGSYRSCYPPGGGGGEWRGAAGAPRRGGLYCAVKRTTRLDMELMVNTSRPTFIR